MLRALTFLCRFCGITATVAAQTVLYANFANTTGLSLNAAEVINGGESVLLATNQQNRSGSLFTQNEVNVGGFSSVFQFRISSPGGTNDGVSAGADGIAFLLQRSGPTALGGNGEAMGYGARASTPAISPSIAIEFDTFRNAWDPSSNHLGINLGGSLTSVASADLPTAFDNGGVWTAWVDYNGSVLEVRLSADGMRPAVATLSYELDVTATLGGTTAFVGFTGATGSSYGNHEIRGFAFNETYLAGGIAAVPEPQTYLLMVSGLVLVGLGIRRRARRVAKCKALGC